MTTGKLLLFAIAAFAFASPTASPAAVVTFPSRTAFDAAFPGSVMETWDAFAPGTTFADGTTAAGITYSTTGADGFVADTFLTTTGSNGLGSTAGGFFDVANAVTFGFGTGRTAFRIDINTFATTAGAYTATTNLGDVALSVFDPFPGETTGQFVGFFSDTAFTSVMIAASPATLNPYTLDTLRATATAPIPEPSTYALLLAGLGIVGFVAKRRRRSQIAAA